MKREQHSVMGTWLEFCDEPGDVSFVQTHVDYIRKQVELEPQKVHAVLRVGTTTVPLSEADLTWLATTLLDALKVQA